jgi:hypothetical protein
VSQHAVTMQVTAYDDEMHLQDADRVLQINHFRIDPPQSTWDEVHGIEWGGDALHDPDCPMTNSDPAARTSCICDRSQWATEDGSHRTVPEGSGDA